MGLQVRKDAIVGVWIFVERGILYGCWEGERMFVRTSALDQDEMEWMTMMLSGRGSPVP